MTVKELITELSKYPGDYGVMIPNTDFHWCHGAGNRFPLTPLTKVVKGVNELEFCLILDDYEEEEEEDDR